MEDFSILSLNDDCLSHIVAFIDIPFSFHSVMLSCKRLNQIATSMESDIWHSNIKRAKIENPLKKAIIEIFSSGEFCDDRTELWFVLDELFDNAIDYSFKKAFWNHPKLVEVWQNYGPVAARVFTWIRSMKHTANVSNHGPKFSSLRWEFTIHLPGSNQDMAFHANYIHPNDPVDAEIGSNRLGLSLHITCGESLHSYQGSMSMLPNEYLTWDIVEKKKIIQQMEPALELLQKELGKTIPLITPNFFVWLCLFFTADNELPEKDQLSFKDSVMNEKPTLDSFNGLFAPNICQLAEEKFKDSGSQYWEKYFGQAENANQLKDTLQTLASQGETQMLKELKGQFSRFAPIAKEFCHYSSMPFLKKALLGLFQRTTFNSTDVFIPPEKKEFENEVFFQLRNGSVLKVFGKIIFIGNKFKYDRKLEIKFLLPNGEVIELNTLQTVDNIYGYSTMYQGKGCWMGLPNPMLKWPIFVEGLSPVTRLLQECINHSLQGEEDVPEIYNIFTALYFLAALDCTEVIGQFREVLDVEEPNDLSNELNQVIMINSEK